jgi:ATP phosphoribosyltransferase
MCVPRPPVFPEDFTAPLRVATKYPTIAKAYYPPKARIDIIRLNVPSSSRRFGHVRPNVDLVETVTKLKQNICRFWKPSSPSSRS